MLINTPEDPSAEQEVSFQQPCIAGVCKFSAGQFVTKSY